MNTCVEHDVSSKTDITVGWTNVHNIGTCYRLDGLGIESRWWRDFLHSSRQVQGPKNPPAQWIPGLIQGVNWLWRGVDNPSPSSAEVNESVQQYIYFPPGLHGLF
jgi:hypothetical protein